jgi:CheY-like chemotaxis protein
MGSFTFKKREGASRILVADDNPTLLHLVTTALRKDGYEVVAARLSGC